MVYVYMHQVRVPTVGTTVLNSVTRSHKFPEKLEILFSVRIGTSYVAPVLIPFGACKSCTIVVSYFFFPFFVVAKFLRHG